MGGGEGASFIPKGLGGLEYLNTTLLLNLSLVRLSLSKREDESEARPGSVGYYPALEFALMRLVLYENLHHIQYDVTSGMQGQTNGSKGQLIQPLTRPDASSSLTSHHRS